MYIHLVYLGEVFLSINCYTKKVTFFRAIVSSLDSNVVFFVGLCATVIVVLFFIVCINLVGLLNC